MNIIGPGRGRGEGMQRIRIGVTGLAFVFLLVLLGTAIGSSREDDLVVAEDLSVLTNKVEAEPSEPLAELGAAPGQPTAGETVTQAPDPTIDGDADEVIVNELARPLVEE